MKKLFTILVMLIAVNANGQWVQQNNGIQNNNNAICLSALGNNIFAGTYNNIYNQGFVYRSTNNGINWVETNLYARVLSFTMLGSNYFAGTDGYGVYISVNNGLNWSQSGLNNKSIRSLTILGSNLYAGTSDSGVFISGNNGSSWTRTSLNNQFVHSLITIGNNIFAGTAYNGVYITTNNGTNWMQTALNNMTVLSLAVSGNNIYAAANDTNGIYISTNNGINWTRTSSTINKYVSSIAVYENNIFAGTHGFANSGGIYLSTNNGINWIEKNQGFNLYPSVYALLVLNNFVLAGTSIGASVWRRAYSEIVDIQNISTEIPSAYSLGQNYPNPFNSTSNLKFQIVKSGNVKLVIYDLTGREVQTLVNENLQPGTYETTFDGSQLTSGIYFYQMVSGDFKQTRKLILLK